MAGPFFEADALIASILSSRKYRSLGIPAETLRDLIRQEQERGGQVHPPKEIEQAVREKLHNIVATYLGDPDYAAASERLDAAFAEGDPQQVKLECRALLGTHASTRERLSGLEEFYQQFFALTGRPQVVLDLACGLHPFGLPWMGLPEDTQYYAYDLHQPRIELINHFFRLAGRPELAFHQDILVEPPQVEADVAFFFKEAHRFEQRQRGCNRAFWQAIRARWLLVSLPANSLTGRRDLAAHQRALVQRTLQGLDWPVTEMQIHDEMIFCIKKEDNGQESRR
jgi:16S rRNA (guanine(1405)-N(7))-methyltransferase